MTRNRTVRKVLVLLLVAAVGARWWNMAFGWQPPWLNPLEATVVLAYAIR